MKENIFELKTYPYSIFLFISIFPVMAIYSLIFSRIDLVGAAIFVVVPVVVFCLLSYVRVTIDKSTGVILVNTITPLKNTKISVLISNVRNIELVVGNGRHAHRGYIEISTDNNKIAITSMGAISRKKQKVLLAEVGRFLGIKFKA